MDKITDYKIVGEDGGDLDDLREDVLKLIEQGWEPYGDPFVRRNEIVQAMVKIRRTSGGGPQS